MISKFVGYLSQLVTSMTAGGMSTLMWIVLASTGIGLFMLVFRFVKAFNIFS